MKASESLENAVESFSEVNTLQASEREDESSSFKDVDGTSSDVERERRYNLLSESWRKNPPC